MEERRDEICGVDQGSYVGLYTRQYVSIAVPTHTHRSFAAMCAGARTRESWNARRAFRPPPPIPNVQPLQPLRIADQEANHLFRAMVCALVVLPALAFRVADITGLLRAVLTPPCLVEHRVFSSLDVQLSASLTVVLALHSTLQILGSITAPVSLPRPATKKQLPR